MEYVGETRRVLETEEMEEEVAYWTEHEDVSQQGLIASFVPAALRKWRERSRTRLNFYVG